MTDSNTRMLVPTGLARAGGVLITLGAMSASAGGWAGSYPSTDPTGGGPVPKPFYGNDDRTEVFQASAAEQAAAASTVAFFQPGALARANDGWRLADAGRVPLSEVKQVCEDERFASQPTAAYCSGVLIDQDKVASAGHCVGGRSPDCEELQLVLGYALTGDGQVRDRYSSSDVYRCKEVITREYQERPQWRDWAVLRLDRPVAGRAPVTVWGQEPPADEELVVIGHPMGLPSKIVAGGQVRSNTPDLPTFKTNLDAYDGNSGSAVFTRSSVERGAPLLVGILVNGARDLRPRDEATGRSGLEEGCWESVRCVDLGEGGKPGDCSGEGVTKAKWMLDALPIEMLEDSSQDGWR